MSAPIANGSTPRPMWMRALYMAALVVVIVAGVVYVWKSTKNHERERY